MSVVEIVVVETLAGLSLTPAGLVVAGAIAVGTTIGVGIEAIRTLRTAHENNDVINNRTETIVLPRLSNQVHQDNHENRGVILDLNILLPRLRTNDVIARRINPRRFLFIRYDDSLHVFVTGRLLSEMVCPLDENLFEERLLGNFRIHFDFRLLTVRRTAHTFQRYERGTTIRPTFRSDGFLTASEAAAYTRSNVRNRLNRLVGTDLIDLYVGNGFVIDRGHLVPSADFESAEERRLTFTYGNVVPMHHQVNAGVWRAIEQWIRNQSERVIVITGTIGVLHLRNSNGQSVPFYLTENNRIPMPEWLYKVIIFPSGKCIIFLVFNNTFCTGRPTEPTINRDVLIGGEPIYFDQDINAQEVPAEIKYDKTLFSVRAFNTHAVMKKKEQ